MPREISAHKTNGCNDAITIEVLDEPGAGGACHLYQIRGFNTGSNPSCPFQKRYGQPADHATVLFQNGPIKECGTNGLTHEALLAILIDRLECFQKGPYACEENRDALFHLREALDNLHTRTNFRVMRGVEGTMQI